MRFRYTMHMSTKWCLTGTTSCIVSLASIHTIKPSAMQPRLINKRNKKSKRHIREQTSLCYGTLIPQNLYLLIFIHKYSPVQLLSEFK